MVQDDALAFLIYVSRETGEMTFENLAELLSKARHFNRSREISGLLLYREGCFLQILEGEKGLISQLFERITTDPRHCKVELILLEATDQRYFGQWSLGYCDLSQPGERELRCYSAFLRQGLKAANAPLAPFIPSGFLKVFADNRGRMVI